MKTQFLVIVQERRVVTMEHRLVVLADTPAQAQARVRDEWGKTSFEDYDFSKKISDVHDTLVFGPDPRQV